MNYCVKNDLTVFEFHDAEFSFVSFENNNLVISAKNLNIHKNTAQNPDDCDMEIDLATITFYDFEMISYESIQGYVTDADGTQYTNDPKILLKNKEAELQFINELKNKLFLDYLEICDNNIIEIGTCASTVFTAIFSYKNICAEWDNYSQKAWYELHKEYKHRITLLTPDGEQETDIRIYCNEEDPSSPCVTVFINYQDKDIFGQGKDYLRADAFADLQKQLPDGVTLKCCLTCRHGNMCPYGNKPNENFCTKGLIITSKDDMCNFFDSTNDTDIEERTRKYTDSCKDYQPQSEDFYTYNDFLYYLNK